MNRIDKFLLKFFLLPKYLFQKYNVDIEQLQAILISKLTIDNRRPSGFKQIGQKREEKEINKASIGMIISSFFMGLFYLFAFSIGNDITTKLTFYFTLLLVFLSLTLITDFTSVLIDVRDNYIILPKPINDSTFVLSRLLHICIYVSKIIIPMILPGLIATAVIGGWLTILPFLLMVVLCTLLAIFLINAVYLLILKITTPTKFQSIITYIQIIFAVIVYGGYQLFPRLLQRAQLDNWKIADHWQASFLPTFWFADIVGSIAHFDAKMQWQNIILAVAVPIISMIVVIKYFAPSFTQKLAMINGNVEESRGKAQKTNTHHRKFIDKLALWLSSGTEEYMGFMFTWKNISRSREFKMKVYPLFGYILVLGAMYVIKKGSNAAGSSISNTPRNILWIIYLMAIIMFSALAQISYSSKYKAAWFYYTSPIEMPGKIILGAIKAVLIRFLVPAFIIILIGSILLFGIQIIPNAIFAMLNVVIFTFLSSFLMNKKLPFSVSYEYQSKGTGFMYSLISTIVPLGIGVFHYFIFNFTWVVIVFSALSVGVIWLLQSLIKNTGWDKIQGATN